MAHLLSSQRALCVAEIVSEILGWVPHFYGAYSPRSWKPTNTHSTFWRIRGCNRRSLAALLRLAKVNTVWFNEAMRLMWKEGTEIKCRPMIGLLAKVHTDHRQLYAAFIESGIILDLRQSKVAPQSQITAGLDFTRLKSLSVVLANVGGEQNLEFPDINAPRLRVLDIRWACQDLCQYSVDLSEAWDPTYHRSRLLSVDMAKFLVNVIKRRFKRLEALTFGPDLGNSDKAMVYLTKELPDVKVTYYQNTYLPPICTQQIASLEEVPLMRHFPGTRLLAG